MKWIRLDAPPGTIILNTGDYMQRISNDLLPSTTHRVSPPRDPALRRQPRVSFPMAVYVWEDEMLEVLPGLGAAEVPAGQGDRRSTPASPASTTATTTPWTRVAGAAAERRIARRGSPRAEHSPSASRSRGRLSHERCGEQHDVDGEKQQRQDW